MLIGVESPRWASEQACVEEAIKTVPIGQVGLAEAKRRDDDTSPPHAPFGHQFARTRYELRRGMLDQLDCRPRGAGPRAGRTARVPLHGPMVAKLGQLCFIDWPDGPARRRQVGVEKRAPQLVQRIGPADDQSAAPMQPIEHGLLLFRRERAGQRIVPDHVRDTRPAQRLRRQGQWLVERRKQHPVVTAVKGVDRCEFHRRTHASQIVQEAVASRLGREHDQEVLKARHVRDHVRRKLRLRSAANVRQPVGNPRRPLRRRLERRARRKEQRLQRLPLPLGQGDNPRGGEPERHPLQIKRLLLCVLRDRL